MMARQPTRQELVAAELAARRQYASAPDDAPLDAMRRIWWRAVEALDMRDLCDWELVRELLDAHSVHFITAEDGENELCFADDGRHGTGTTRSEALIDLARKWAASDDTTPAGEAGEERAT